MDCVAGACAMTSRCEFFASANDMGDPGGCAEPYHEELHWRDYCTTIGGRAARQCNDATTQPGPCGGAGVLDGYVFCDGALVRDGSNFCIDSVGGAASTVVPHGNGVIYRVWLDNANGVSDGVSVPSEEEIYTDLMETPSNICDSCSSELVGYFLAPADGAYTFVIASDNAGHLYISSPGATPVEIATVSVWTGARQWDKDPEQTSAPQQLTAGTYYYLRATAVESGGGDNLAIGVTLPDGTILQPLPVMSPSDGTPYLFFSRDQQMRFAGSTHTGGRTRDDGNAALPGAFYKMWTGIEGSSIADFMADPDFLDHADNADVSTIMTDFFAAPTNSCELCAEELIGWFLAPTAGAYTFQIAADDNGALYFGESETAGTGEMMILY